MNHDPQVAKICRRWALLALYVARDAAHRANHHLPIPGLARVAYLTPRGLTLAEHGRDRLARELRETLGTSELELLDLGQSGAATARSFLDACTRVWCLDPEACDELLTVNG